METIEERKQKIEKIWKLGLTNMDRAVLLDSCPILNRISKFADDEDVDFVFDFVWEKWKSGSTVEVN